MQSTVTCTTHLLGTSLWAHWSELFIFHRVKCHKFICLSILVLYMQVLISECKLSPLFSPQHYIHHIFLPSFNYSLCDHLFLQFVSLLCNVCVLSFRVVLCIVVSCCAVSKSYMQMLGNLYVCDYQCLGLKEEQISTGGYCKY